MSGENRVFEDFFTDDEIGGVKKESGVDEE